MRQRAEAAALEQVLPGERGAVERRPVRVGVTPRRLRGVRRFRHLSSAVPEAGEHGDTPSPACPYGRQPYGWTCPPAGDDPRSPLVTVQ